MKQQMTKEEKFENIYRTYEHDVYRVALYFTKDAFTAQDVSQKAFYNFYLHMDNVSEERIRPYLLRTARNLSYNWTRDSRWEYQGEYLENIPEDKLSLLGPEEAYVRQEYQRDVKEFFDELMSVLQEENESWYNILTLVYGLGKKQEDVAYELGLTLEVLHSKIYRAKRWIRKRYENEYRRLREKY